MFQQININFFLVFLVWLDSVPAAIINQKPNRSSITNRNHITKETQTPWELIEALTATSGLRGFNGTWFADEEFYYTASDRSIHTYNAATNQSNIFLPKEFLQSYSGATFTLSPDNIKILVRYQLESGFRHSFIAKYDVYDIINNSTIPIHGGRKLQYCGWSPLKDRLAYVYENNVYIHFEDGKEVQITHEGVEGVIYNGVPDWVYEEEVLSSGSALWWSPDGLKLAVGFFNDTNVETFTYFLYGESENPDYLYPREIDLKYPKTGTPNPLVALRIYDFTLNKEAPSSVELTAPENIVSKDNILENVAWANSTNVIITWLNRRQNIGSLQLCSVNGVCREVKRLEEPKGWVTISVPKCLSSGSKCIFRYWIDNSYQVWNLDLVTKTNIWKSRGEFTILNIYGYDEVNDKLFYQATLHGDPTIYHVFSNDDCLSCNVMDTDGVACRSASASFSRNFSYYTLICNGPNPIFTKIFETKTNNLVFDWELNTAYRAQLKTKMRPSYKFFNVSLADGSLGVAKLALPPNFDESRKYPLIVNVYGGPNSVRVTNTFVLGYEAFVTTKREVIYAYIDGRGTGNKGKDLLFSVNNDLGDHEVEDQLFVTEWLQDHLNYIDRNRTAIWGWSYGGYMTARTLAADNRRIFQCGISVAPVTSWLLYDTIYTERYMGLPTEEDNIGKYYESSVLNNVENFRTHDFLLVHGSADDNVHYQNTLLLAKLLQQHDIPFTEQTYTDENHSIGNRLPHLYNTIDRFWSKCLNIPI